MRRNIGDSFGSFSCPSKCTSSLLLRTSRGTGAECGLRVSLKALRPVTKQCVHMALQEGYRGCWMRALIAPLQKLTSLRTC